MMHSIGFLYQKPLGRQEVLVTQTKYFTDIGQNHWRCKMWRMIIIVSGWL